MNRSGSVTAARDGSRATAAIRWLTRDPKAEHPLRVALAATYLVVLLLCAALGLIYFGLLRGTEAALAPEELAKLAQIEVQLAGIVLFSLGPPIIVRLPCAISALGSAPTVTRYMPASTTGRWCACRRLSWCTTVGRSAIVIAVFRCWAARAGWVRWPCCVINCFIDSRLRLRRPSTSWRC